MHEWFMNIHYKTWIAQGWFTNIILTPSKQWGVCDKSLKKAAGSIWLVITPDLNVVWSCYLSGARSIWTPGQPAGEKGMEDCGALSFASDGPGLQSLWRLGDEPCHEAHMGMCRLREYSIQVIHRIHLTMSSAKWWPFCPGGCDLTCVYLSVLRSQRQLFYLQLPCGSSVRSLWPLLLAVYCRA